MRYHMKWGGILAGGIIAWTLLVHLLGFYTTRIQYSDIVDTVVIVIPIAVTVLALLERRRALRGRLPFLQGVGASLGVSAASAIPTVAGLWVYHHFINPEWLTYVIAHKRAQFVAQNLPLDEIAKRLDAVQRGGGDGAQIISGLIGTVVLGLVLGILIAGVFYWKDQMNPPVRAAAPRP